MATRTESPIQVEITPDRLRAQVVAMRAGAAGASREDLVAKLTALGVQLTDAVKERIEGLLAAAPKGEKPQLPYLLAEGRAPVPAQPARFAPVESTEEDEPDRIDLHQSQIVTVNVGDVIGSLIPETPGEPGLDVFGAEILPDPPTVSFSVGENVSLGSDGKTLTATEAGKVHVTRSRIAVLQVVSIKGDVDPTTGDVDSPTDILVGGTIRESFKVRSAKSITVRGAIEAAEVQAGTEVHVHGGVAARSKGRVVAGGDIFAKFCDGADLRAGGDITIATEAMNSILKTRGHLDVTRGAIIGGYTLAREGASVNELGNEANLATRIAIGMDPDVLLEAAERDKLIKKKQEAIAIIRQKVQPLMAMLKRLTPQQREQATELMFQADQMETEVRTWEAEKAAAIEAARPPAPPVLLVTRMIHPNVTVIFGDKMATFSTPRRGRVKIMRRLENRVEEIVVVDLVSGNVSTMVSGSYTRTAGNPAKA